MHAQRARSKGVGVKSLCAAAALAAELAVTVFGLRASAPERPKITGVSHLSILTTDSAKTEFFFVHDLGAVKRPDAENRLGARYYFNAIQFVEVLPMSTPASGAAPRLTRLDHSAFNTSNADDLRRYLDKHGVQIPPAVRAASDGSRYFTVNDPEGNRVEFVQPPDQPEPVPPNPLSDHILHVGYIVHDPAAEDAFYIALLGFRAYWRGGAKDDRVDWISQQVPDGTDWIEYMVVKGTATSGIPPEMSQQLAGVLDHFALGVQNMEQAVDLLDAGDRLTARHSAPQIGRDGKWQINMYAPDGTRAELMEFQPSVKPCCSPFLLPNPTK
jgi:catechol 2,3-dioxygenase-like lactoylglutathione lyase family enzyme